jgi:hypothetical protein
MYRREFFRKMMQAIPLFSVTSLEAGSGISRLMATNSIPGLQASNIDLNLTDDSPTMTAEVIIREIEHYYFPKAPIYLHNGEWVSRDHSQVNVYCTAESWADDFELELYFDEQGKDWVSQVLHDLTEGSRWLVAGHYSIVDGGITLFGSGYKKAGSSEWVKTPVS